MQVTVDPNTGLPVFSPDPAPTGGLSGSIGGGGTSAVEGTAVLSTGEAGGSKFLREDGDGTSSWIAIPGADDNYVTDAEKTVIGNTSGTNTGDNATNTQYSGLAASKQDTITVGTTAPVSPATNDLWVDTN